MKFFQYIAVILMALSFVGCNQQEGSEDFSKLSEDSDRTVDDIIDMDLFDKAIASDELVLCENIVDKNLKKDCEDVVSANLLTEQALNELSSEYCSQISNKRMSNNCEDLVEIEIARLNEKEDFHDFIQEQTDLVDSIVHSGNYERCVDVQDENFRQECYLNTFAILIQKSGGDSSICDEVRDNKLEELCRLSN